MGKWKLFSNSSRWMAGVGGSEWFRKGEPVPPFVLVFWTKAHCPFKIVYFTQCTEQGSGLDRGNLRDMAFKNLGWCMRSRDQVSVWQENFFANTSVKLKICCCKCCKSARFFLFPMNSQKWDRSGAGVVGEILVQNCS